MRIIMGEELREPSLVDWLALRGGMVCLVFADIVGSVLLVHAQGTRVFAHVLSAYRARAEELAENCAGRIISKEGDEIFAAFLDVVSGYRFARELSVDAGHPLISVRVGLHVGKVSCHDGRLVGRTVPMTNRIMDRAGSHEIWMSGVAKDAIGAEQPRLLEQIEWVTSEVCALEGIPEPQRLWRAI